MGTAKDGRCCGNQCGLDVTQKLLDSFQKSGLIQEQNCHKKNIEIMTKPKSWLIKKKSTHSESDRRHLMWSWCTALTDLDRKRFTAFFKLLQNLFSSSVCRWKQTICEFCVLCFLFCLWIPEVWSLVTAHRYHGGEEGQTLERQRKRLSTWRSTSETGHYHTGDAQTTGRTPALRRSTREAKTNTTEFFYLPHAFTWTG